MPRRFFRKFAVKRHEFSERWFLSPFRHLMHDHRLWSIRRRTVVPAVALGAFVAFLPFPGHPVWASFTAVAVRINVPIAALTTFISNPLTMGPMYYLAYSLGAWILGIEQQPFAIEMSIDWVTHTFVNIWQPMLLGCILLGSTAALIAYVGLDLLWRSSIGNYKSRKRRQRDQNEL
ncbi:MAG: DUF2062 domain-containing protein [Woeseiaceae bacterium]